MHELLLDGEEVAKFKHLGGGELRAQPGPNKYCAPAQTKTEHATQLRRVSFLFRPRHCPFRDLSLFRHGIVLSLWGGRAPRSPPPSLMLTPILVWGHPPCGHCHAGARQWSSVMVSLRSSLSLVEIMYSNSLGGRKAAEPVRLCPAPGKPREAYWSGSVDLPNCTQSTQSRRRAGGRPGTRQVRVTYKYLAPPSLHIL